MSAVDFTEIPRSNKGDESDEFEIFAADFLDTLGLSVIRGPSRGADGGRDLVVEEAVNGSLSKSSKRWLVSCKHFAHSGRSVGHSYEQNVSDRVQQHQCDGFLAFYSTLPSTALENRLAEIKVECQTWSKGRIADTLVSSQQMSKVFRRYFPKSYQAWVNLKPANLFDVYEPLPCRHCGEDLLLPGNKGVIVWLRERNNEHRTIVDVYVACKGECDTRCKTQSIVRLGRGKVSDAWDDIDDWKIPAVFIDRVIASLNRLRDGLDTFNNGAFTSEKSIFLRIAQLAFRTMSHREIERVRLLRSISF